MLGELRFQRDIIQILEGSQEERKEERKARKGSQGERNFASWRPPLLCLSPSLTMKIALVILGRPSLIGEKSRQEIAPKLAISSQLRNKLKQAE